MKLIYHRKYLTDYPTASVEQPARVKTIYETLSHHYSVLTPEPATEAELLLVHNPELIDRVKNNGGLYEVACLAAGGAILAAELACQGEPAFAAIRPPGHHASPCSHWGFCFFNNLAVAIEHQRNKKVIERALILDIDLHFGDGTVNVFRGRPGVTVINIAEKNRDKYLQEVEVILSDVHAFDLLGVSAGFDTYQKDWGGLLLTEDYFQIGRWIKDAARVVCQGRRFAVLEGGYYLPDLGKNALAFVQGLE
ncbi:MAG: histone deacetylase family protein [Deltaproteobacteria bacterium]|nr:histone deacetylase family protein [Deltaproteobacteria bacterium]MBW1986167.1 histone deacetylase family protein [Deltaproteobacteria bacterium]